MIELRTGLPGAGKTLLTIADVRNRAEKEGRPVFYSGIEDLRLPWTLLEDATQWHTLPPKAIVVIDEAQRVFRPRHVGSQVPEHVAKLETHRHLGIDLVLITQHPKLIDPNVRRLTGRHVHVVRAFGSNSATLHEWGEVQEDPSARGESMSRLVPYPKEVFALYKSAEAHTHKRRIPARVFALVAIPLALGALAWMTHGWVSSKIEGEKDATPIATPTAVTQMVGLSRPASGGTPPAVDWFESHQPRVPGLPHTAPAFDSVTAPAVAPAPVACAASASRCRCYTSQATAIDMPEDMCRKIVANGFFVAWQQPAQQPMPQQGHEGEQPAPVVPVGFPGRRPDRSTEPGAIPGPASAR
ncbi:MAG: zonular occludens toxin [Inoviridae sp. ctBZ32]|nr:MAG: zonular occludens toxin [Inoviridae sp. ctBZ32]